MRLKSESALYPRQSTRLKEYDYAQAGTYFVTICTNERHCLFGKIINGAMDLNKYGRIVQNEWLKTASIRQNVLLDEFIVMPNHFQCNWKHLTKLLIVKPLKINGLLNFINFLFLAFVIKFLLDNIVIFCIFFHILFF